jgi:hypothetical protein
MGSTFPWVFSFTRYMRGIIEMLIFNLSDFRPQQTLALMTKTSGLFAKVDFKISAVVDDNANLRDRMPGSQFRGEQPWFIFHPIHAMLRDNLE